MNNEEVKRRTSEYNRLDYLKRREELLIYWKYKNLERKDKLTEKFNCECGGKYTYNHRKGHFRSLKHQRYLENKKLNITQCV